MRAARARVHGMMTCGGLRVPVGRPVLSCFGTLSSRQFTERELFIASNSQIVHIREPTRQGAEREGEQRPPRESPWRKRRRPALH